MIKIASLMIAAAALSACGSSSASPDLSATDVAEMEDLKAWGKQLKADDPDTARALVRECMAAGSLFSDSGKLAVARCMKAKYDEGERA